MPNNYVLLEKITVGAAGAASVTFANIPQTGYTDLVIKSSMRTNGSSFPGNPWQNLSVALNTNTGSTYRQLFGTGAGVGSDQQAAGFWGTNNVATANTFSNNEIYIPNYTSSAAKSISIDNVTENNGTDFAAVLWAANYSGVTASVTSITLTPLSGSLLQFSTFYLYGVAALGTTPAIAPKASGGDIIATDGTYWYHAFRSSGTFTPAANLTCGYLVVAGGGGSGFESNAGGGGAGGLRSTVTATGGGGALESAVSMAFNTTYTITIGAGGAAAFAGSNTSISGTGLTTITSTGGGYGANSGGQSTQKDGGAGGSGGGAGYSGSTYGAGTSGQGYRGGSGYSTSSYGSGGGGGAGAVGGDATASGAGAGGNGVQITAFATPTETGANSGYYAGGGGGAADSGSFGAAGLGGGGRGGQPQATGSTAGTANTGGGGGGYAKSGGSGIVIIRYPVAS
jgi:hypothetical protein